MIKDFKSKLATSTLPILISSNNLRLLILLRKVAIRELSKRFSIQRSFGDCDDPDLEELVDSMTPVTLFGQKQILYISDFNPSSRNLNQLNSVIKKGFTRFVIDTAEPNPELNNILKSKVTILDYRIKYSSDLLPLAREVLGATKAEKLRQILSLETPDSALNLILIARLTNFSDFVKRSKPSINELVNSILARNSPLKILRQMSGIEVNFMYLITALQKNIFSMMYVKNELGKRNLKVVPIWVRSLISPYLRFWDEEKLSNFLNQLLKAEVNFKTSSLPDRELIFKTLSKVGLTQ